MLTPRNMCEKCTPNHSSNRKYTNPSMIPKFYSHIQRLTPNLVRFGLNLAAQNNKGNITRSGSEALYRSMSCDNRSTIISFKAPTTLFHLNRADGDHRILLHKNRRRLSPLRSFANFSRCAFVKVVKHVDFGISAPTVLHFNKF